MKLQHVPIDTLAFDPNNARKHSARNIKAIKGSLAKFGQQKPIVVSQKNVVLAGNGTLQAAKELGWDKIWVYKTDLTGIDASAFSLADNRTSELADWEDEILLATLSELQHLDFPLDDIGFDAKDLDKMMKANEPKPEKEKDFASMFEVVVECQNESEQEQVFSDLTAKGYKCRVLSM